MVGSMIQEIPTSKIFQRESWNLHPASKDALAAWYRVMRCAVFANFLEIRRTLGSADYVAPYTIFNVGGNKYRVITVIHYNRRRVYIRHVATAKRTH
jgi:mRNA interferase HigB